MNIRLQRVRRERKKSFYLRELSTILGRLVVDEPSLQALYFSRVDLSADGGSCHIYCAFVNATSIDEGKELFEKARQVLVLYRGSIRSALAKAMQSRYVPELRFFFDEAKEKELRVTGLLAKVGDEIAAYDAQNAADEHTVVKK